MKTLAAGAEWSTLYERAQQIAPEAFLSGSRVLNHALGEWGHPGQGKSFLSPCDGTELGTYPCLDLATAEKAVTFAAKEHKSWSRVDLDERKRRVQACVDQLKRHRDLIASFLVWEIGKPFAQAQISVDRCVSGVQWYIDHIEPMLNRRKPLGLVSNIASWNYPMSVLMHAMLVQSLAGNAVIAKAPTDGGLCALTLSVALACRAGLPISLISGSGRDLSPSLVGGQGVACVAFVGGKSTGREVADRLASSRKRYMLEMEGINAWGVWDFSDWPTLEAQLKKNFEYGKQRCTAHPRYVVQRALMPKFLRTYMRVLDRLTVGHPWLAAPDGAPAAVDFGPVINKKKAVELEQCWDDAVAKGAVPLYVGQLEDARFFDGQDKRAYVAPRALLGVPHSCNLFHYEPFGPIDSIVVVDSVEELVADMNISGGSLVATLSTDDRKLGESIAPQLRAFKVGINRVRSRGDREELFGGVGESWRGCFVGGELLVQAVTESLDGTRLYGNFPEYTLLPERR